MIWDLIGVTGWTLEQVKHLTFPQLEFLLRGRGRILYPRLEPALNANLANLSAEPGSKGEPSEADKIIARHKKTKAGIITPQTAKEQALGYARRIILAPYWGDPDADQPEVHRDQPQAFPGMGVDEARAWVAFVRSGVCPDNVWLEIGDVYPAIFIAAQIK